MAVNPIQSSVLWIFWFFKIKCWWLKRPILERKCWAIFWFFELASVGWWWMRRFVFSLLVASSTWRPRWRRIRLLRWVWWCTATATTTARCRSFFPRRCRPLFGHFSDFYVKDVLFFFFFFFFFFPLVSLPLRRELIMKVSCAMRLISACAALINRSSSRFLFHFKLNSDLNTNRWWLN